MTLIALVKVRCVIRLSLSLLVMIIAVIVIVRKKVY